MIRQLLCQSEIWGVAMYYSQLLRKKIVCFCFQAHQFCYQLLALLDLYVVGVVTVKRDDWVHPS